MEGSPNPIKLNVASANIAAGTANAILANVSGKSCGKMCRSMILISLSPMSFEASTYCKFFICNARLLATLAIPLQPKMTRKRVMR